MRKPALLILFSLVLVIPVVTAGPGLFFIPMKYKGSDVSGGGSIKGTVTLDAIPDVPEMVINKNAQVCEHAKVSPRFVCDKATKGLGNVVVWIDGIKTGKKKVKGEFVIDQKNCHYVPHISIVPTRSTLHVKSSDPILHNVHAFKGTPDAPHSMTADVLNLAFKDNRVDPAPFDRRSLRKPGFYYLKCDNGHYWMSAYIWVVEHPYYAVTDSKGRFELKDVPAGKYTLRFWHENWNAKPVEKDGTIVSFSYGKPLTHTTSVTVTAGAPVEANWQVPAK